MQLKQWIRTILLITTIVTLTACHHARKPVDQASIDNANAAYQDDAAQASGAGDEDANFNDQAGKKHSSNQSLSKKVYYFDFDSNVVRDSDKPAIEANADYVATHANAKVMLEGHTDPRGSREYNIGLGERRAKAVANVATATGVRPSQIRVVSYGAEKLASAGHSEADYQQDRRVVLVYLQR
jgi:peptidoglycan-associated lipoprotein